MNCRPGVSIIRHCVFIVSIALLFQAVQVQAQESKENSEFKLAINLYKDGMYDLAIEQLKNFITAYPSTSQSIDARFYLGQTQMKLKRSQQVVTRFTT